MAESLTEYLENINVKVRYLHSDIHTIERMEIIRDLRLGEFDVLVGINLLREGLDIPEVSLVAVLDADKEGFLRSETSLIQTIGRAARNAEGRVIMYADTVTDSLRRAIDETERRRLIQTEYNKATELFRKPLLKGYVMLLNPPRMEAEPSEASCLKKKEKGLAEVRGAFLRRLSAVWDTKDRVRRTSQIQAACFMKTPEDLFRRLKIMFRLTLLSIC